MLSLSMTTKRAASRTTRAATPDASCRELPFRLSQACMWHTDTDRKVLYIGSGADLSERIGRERRLLSFDPEHR